ncbi:MAG TPA: sugar phosphate isomerase/epimerase family protein [Candidatus Limnocylindria bacterium]|nr:sugar phosphate isomerase/epimerase family protein [Candidatus Limnocylindria bacterium]
MTRLAVQSRLVPGGSLREKHDNALRYGFDGLELSHFPMVEAAREAIREAVPVTAMCSGHRGWFIDPEPTEIAACIEDVKTLLELGAELDAGLIIVPIYGRSARLPPHCGTGRTREEDEALWLGGLEEVTRHAEKVGGRLIVEAINRYENPLSITVADALRYARAADSPQVKMMGDVFHMNIEEADPAAALEACAGMLSYVHLADNQRLEPGTGHFDFAAVFAALERIGYDGFASLECGLSGPAEEVLPRSAEFLRAQMPA